MTRSSIIILALSFLFSGCGNDNNGPQRRIVEGGVTYNSHPIAYGSIRFIPQPVGPVATAIIVDGKFRCDARGGVPVGDVRIEIESAANTTGMSEDEIATRKSPPVVPVPDKYNRDSKLVDKIPSGTSPHVLNIRLDK